MKSLKQMSKDELLQLRIELEKSFKEAKGKGLKLDLSRGKPSLSQLDIARGMMDILNSSSNFSTIDGIDCRNYGILDGIPEAKKLMADIIEVSPENVIVCGNSSLTIMHDMIARSMLHGVLGGTPWAKLDKVKFLCPVPGYDRHFAITELFGIEMIPISMTTSGPNMDKIEELVSHDASIKGIWCTPKYSNPLGISYSDETVKRFAQLKPAATDFRIFWDNAYAIHHLYEENQDTLLELLSECEKAGNPDMVYEFTSTSKVSFAGGGLACVASSKANIEFIKKFMSVQTIGYDKINQLKHVRYFKDINGMKAHMKKHAAILRPKFEIVLDVLEKELGGLEIADWGSPKGGYFIPFESMEGCAKSIIAKCKEVGVTMTNAGSTYPYGNDPHDSNIRFAPSFPHYEELREAALIFTLCVKLVSVNELLK